MIIRHYSTETKAGETVDYYGEGIKAYDKAKLDAQENKLRVVEMQFEYTDSELVDDFT